MLFSHIKVSDIDAFHKLIKLASVVQMYSLKLEICFFVKPWLEAVRVVYAHTSQISAIHSADLWIKQFDRLTQLSLPGRFKTEM